MKKSIILFTFLSISLMLVPAVMATNGTNLIGIGPVSRSMGGAGVAAPQDAISAIFSNPAAMCFGPYCPGSSADFAGTYFDPTVTGTVPTPGGPATATSQTEPFMVPAIGISNPITEKLRFGIGMYGQSGMGTDYKGTAIGTDATNYLYTQLQTMKFAPNLAWLITPNFSVGASVEVVWQSLDLGQGAAAGYGLGLQIGALYHLGKFNFGASYTTPESITHKNVSSFGGATWYDLKLENPQTVKLGVSFEPNTSWLIEGYTRWYGWGSADGYKDFGWDDQVVFGIGAQWRPAEKWAIRAGYNYGKNPVSLDAADSFRTSVQGIPVSPNNYEGLRIVGFPAIAEQHFTAGVGYNLTQNWLLNLSFVYSPEETITQGPLSASLKEFTSTFGLTYYW